MCAFMRVRVRVRVRAYMRTYMRACVRACVHACVRACMFVHSVFVTICKWTWICTRAFT